MRIVVMGQAAFGESVLKKLKEQGEDVVAVFTPPDAEGRPADPLKAAAEGFGIPVYQFKRMRDAAAVEAFKGLSSDLLVMAFVTDIVPMEVLNAPTQGSICFHPSLLPEHRGPSSINWPIIQGKTKTGLTVFWPDDGLDTGPILLQKEVEIGPDDTLGTIYFGKIYDLGVEAMAEAVALIKAGAAPRIEQDESKATYEGWCKAENVVIDWSQPVDAIYNLVRGSDPSPGSGTTFKGDAVRFFNTSKDSGGTDRAPGTVEAITDKGIALAAEGGSITVGRVQPAGEKKMDAKEWAERVGLSVGDRFGA